jgi:hypothetical protein
MTTIDEENSTFLVLLSKDGPLARRGQTEGAYAADSCSKRRRRAPGGPLTFAAAVTFGSMLTRRRCWSALGGVQWGV